MSDVQEKCVAAGFSDYVTKPVDFVDLSTAMSKFMGPVLNPEPNDTGHERPHELG